MSYWNKKDEYKKYAISHTKEMNKKCASSIKHSVNRTRFYDDDAEFRISIDKEQNSSIILENSDTVSSIISNYKGTDRMIALNFASFKHPGGMFLDGSSAQEESLCRSSFLYNVLSSSKLNYYYKENNNNELKNNHLYVNRALVSPDIIFEDFIKCDILTCAAPNFSAASKYRGVTKEENSYTLKSRIKFVLDCCVDGNYDTLILGAYGCGVFGQDATEVANIFLSYLFSDEYRRKFKKVIFAIPKSDNYDKFFNAFKMYESKI